MGSLPQYERFVPSLGHRMARAPDSTIPADEALYRSVAKDHVDEHGVLAAAVEMPACSFNRSKHSKPDDIIVSSRPTENGILEITPSELPPPVPRASGEPYEFLAEDDPIEENEAHCEVRIHRTNTPYTRSHRPKKDIIMKARAELAKRMRVYKAPCLGSVGTDADGNSPGRR